MNDFGEIHNNLSNEQLLSMLMNSGDYQEAALVSARRVLLLRGFSEEELEKELMKRKAMLGERTAFHESIDKEREGPKTEITINVLSIIFLVLMLIAAFLHVLTLLRIASGILPMFPAIIDPVFGLSVLPYALYEFYKRRKAGWFIIVVFFSFKLCQLFFSFGFVMLNGGMERANGLIVLIGLFLISIPIVFLWQLTKRRLRERFAILKTTSNLVIGITCGLSFIYYVFVHFTGNTF